MMTKLFMLMSAAVVLTGCSYTNLGEILKAAGQDPATVNVSVKSIYGSIQYCRTAILNGNVTCDSNGISVKSEAANVGVPMTITPQLSVGQPTLTPPPPAKAVPPTVIPQSAPAKPMTWLDPPDIIRAILQDAPQ